MGVRGRPQWLIRYVERKLRRKHVGGPGGCAEPTALDMWLVQVAYEVVAAESRCAKCGSPLGRGLLLAPSSEVHPLFRWRVSIATRCSGWRRHRHVANVVKASNDLLLGSLHLG